MINLIITAITLSLASINSEVGNALSANDSKTLSNFFNNNIDLTIIDQEGTYSKIQAEQIVKKFLSTHNVIKYSAVHLGKAKDGSSFEIGKLQTKAGTYRTYFLLKGEGVAQKIHQFRIENDNE